jgi:hypothetical protein
LLAVPFVIAMLRNKNGITPVDFGIVDSRHVNLVNPLVFYFEFHLRATIRNVRPNQVQQIEWDVVFHLLIYRFSFLNSQYPKIPRIPQLFFYIKMKMKKKQKINYFEFGGI